MLMKRGPGSWWRSDRMRWWDVWSADKRSPRLPDGGGGGCESGSVSLSAQRRRRWPVTGQPLDQCLAPGVYRCTTPRIGRIPVAADPWQKLVRRQRNPSACVLPLWNRGQKLRRAGPTSAQCWASVSDHVSQMSSGLPELLVCGVQSQKAISAMPSGFAILWASVWRRFVILFDWNICSTFCES